jgi:cobalamin biosynthesis Mg chelatase CobN
VKRGEHRPPECDRGTWTFAGSDATRNATKWRCPTGECKPASCWIKADRLHPLVPRETRRWRDLYRGRAAVEREFGRLKHEWASARSGYAASSASRSTSTSACSRGSPARSPEREPYRSRRRFSRTSRRKELARVILAVSTVSVVAIAVVAVVALIALMYLLPRRGRKRSPKP